MMSYTNCYPSHQSHPRPSHQSHPRISPCHPRGGGDPRDIEEICGVEGFLKLGKGEKQRQYISHFLDPRLRGSDNFER